MRHRKAKPTLENEDLLVIPISQTNTSVTNVTGITIYVIIITKPQYLRVMKSDSTDKLWRLTSVMNNVFHV